MKKKVILEEAKP